MTVTWTYDHVYNSAPVRYVGFFVLWLLSMALMDIIMRRRGLPRTNAPLEPPSVTAVVPYLGHYFGLARHKTAYYTSKRFKLPGGICTVKLLTYSQYVVTNHELAQEISKKVNRFSFSGIASVYCDRMAGLSPEGSKLIQKNSTGSSPREPSFFIDSKRSIESSVQPGPYLDQMLDVIGEQILNLHDKNQVRLESHISLFSWLREVFTVIITHGAYGTQNPFFDLDIVEAFWAFDDSTLPYFQLPAILQPILNRQSFIGREACVRAFVDYFNSDGTASASEVVKARQRLMNRYHVSVEDQARIEVVNCIALTENTVATLFWALYHVITRPELLSESRRAAQRYVKRSSSSSINRLDLRGIREDRLLVAIVNETIRCASNAQETRVVYDQDVTLNCGYRLREGNLVIIPARSIHTDPDVFRTAPPQVFEPSRFLGKSAATSQHDLPQGAFRGFGGGDALCPGRHLAMSEILGVMAFLILTYDFDVDAENTGLPPLGVTLDQNAFGISRPDREVWVKLRRLST